MARGGSRPNSGRKTKADEQKVMNQSIEAITSKYGSVVQGMVALLDSEEPSLIKFVWEHGVGKSPDKVEGEITNKIKLHIVRGRNNAE